MTASSLNGAGVISASDRGEGLMGVRFWWTCGTCGDQNGQSLPKAAIEDGEMRARLI